MSLTSWFTNRLSHKVLAPWVGAVLAFGLGMHFLWLPVRIADVRDDFRGTQESMLAVLSPALVGLLLGGDSVQVHSMLKQVERDIPHWVTITLDTPSGERLYPLETRPSLETNDVIWFKQDLRYKESKLGDLRIAADPKEVLQAEKMKVLRLEASLFALMVLTAALFVWIQRRWIVRPLQRLVFAADRLADDDFSAELPIASNDEVGDLVRSFGAMRNRREQSDIDMRDAQRLRELALREAEQSARLLRESVSCIAQGFTIYDENDRLVICNEAYRGMYEASRDLIVQGSTFEDIVRLGAERGQYVDAIGHVDDWVRERVKLHQKADGQVMEQRLGDGRWLLIVEYRTPSGYIVGNRVDITELKQTAENLRLGQLYLRATLDNLPFLFWLKDASGRFLAVNKVFSDTYGSNTPEALIGKTDFDIALPDVAQYYRASDLEVMATGKDCLIEEPMVGSAGDRWAEVFKKRVVADDGSLLGIVGFARDITERKEMLQALAENEQRWTLAVQGANDGIWDWDIKSGLVFFSERWKAVLGHAVPEIGDRMDEWRSRIHPEHREWVLAELDRHLRGESQYYQCEYPLRSKEGGYKWVNDRGQALFNTSGEPTRMAGSLTDITERRKAEARVHDWTEQLSAIFSLSPDGFVSFDKARRVKYANPAFLKLSGLGEGSLMGLDEDSFVELLAQECKPHSRFPRLTTLRAASSDERRVVELAGAGQRILEYRLRVSNTHTVSQILYFRDVTHETEVDHMKSEFLATAAHELRTPMASVYGFSELLLSQEFSVEDQHEYLGIIYKQSNLMMSILNELLDLARIESRRGKDFQLMDIEVHGLLREVIAAHKTDNGRTPPSLSTTLGSFWVRGDHGKLIQAISNVLSNAYKYSPDGGSVDAFVLEEASDDAEFVGIRVSDHGIGMTPSQLARVCERFYRADASGQIPGTGLGMSIVKEIVELHGGRVDIVSQPGQGTSMTMWLPKAKGAC
jgi:PAS domain S-box-containing protein